MKRLQAISFNPGDYSVLIDCGSAVLSKLQLFLPVEELDAVILSHYHHDHIADVGPLQFAKLVGSFLGKGADALPIYGHPFDEEQFSNLHIKRIPLDWRMIRHSLWLSDRLRSRF